MTPLWIITGLSAVGSYLVGAVPSGLIIGRAKGVDVRKAGSGNIGAANVGRLVGREWGVVVFLLDVLKGLIPTAVIGQILDSLEISAVVSPWTVPACWLLAGFCSVLGHNYSPFLGFRGGKGVATSLGVALAVYPYLTIPAFVAFGVWVLGIRLTGMSSLGSICGGIVFPIACVILVWAKGEALADNWPFLAFSLLVSVLLVLRHRANLARILSGTEARFGRSGPTDASSGGDER